MVKNLPITQEMQETQLQSLCWEDPLEEEMATHSSIFARRIPWTEEPVATVHWVAKSWTRLRTHAQVNDHLSTYNVTCTG